MDMATSGAGCHYCHAPVYWAKVNKTGKPFGYNLDRKDSAEGYTNQNCVICCHRCNRGKNNLFTYDEWFAMTSMFRKRRKANGTETESTAVVDGGSPTTDSSIGGLVGEAQTIAGVGSDGSSNDCGAEDSVNEGSTEGLVSSLDTV
jgi:hypothetical protein